MKREALGHAKFKLLARDLGMEVYSARGLVVTMWLVAGISYHRGDIGRLTNEELAVAIDYEGDADVMVAAMIKRRLLDEIPASEGRLYVHDWHEHADDYVHSRIAKAIETFANGMFPRVPHDYFSGPTRKRIQAQYEERYGVVPSEEESVAAESQEGQDELPIYEKPSGQVPDESPECPDSSGTCPEPSGICPDKSGTGPGKVPSSGLVRSGMEITPPYNPPAEPPPWWPDCGDETVRRLVELIRSAKRYEADVPDSKRVQELVAWAREFAPDDAAILNVGEAFVDRAKTKRRREYEDPLRALKNWIERREAEWRRTRRQREIDQERNPAAKSKTPPPSLVPVPGVDFVLVRTGRELPDPTRPGYSFPEVTRKVPKSDRIFDREAALEWFDSRGLSRDEAAQWCEAQNPPLLAPDSGFSEEAA